MSGARLLGRYVVGERLGSGGLGEVYLAHVDGARGFRKRVVVKQVRRELASRPEVATLLLAEAEVVQRLSHGNIVQVLDYGIDEQTPYLVMEHVDGVALTDLLHDLRRRGAPLGLAAALFVVESVCAALAHAHATRDADDHPLGLVHRDVTPGNILVSRDGVVKLTDFGIASLTAAADASPGAGTPGYAAPEQLAGQHVDGRADVYALGVVFSELLACCPDAPAELHAIAGHAAARSLAQRLPDATSLAAALETWRASRHILHAPAELAACVRDLQRRRGQLADQLGAALEQRVRAPETAALPPRRAHRPARRWLGPGATLLAAATLFVVTRDRESPTDNVDSLAAPANTDTTTPDISSRRIDIQPAITTPATTDAVTPEFRSRHDDVPHATTATPTSTDSRTSDSVQPAINTSANTDAMPPGTPTRSDTQRPGGPLTTPPTTATSPERSKPRPRESASGRLLVNLVPWAEASVDGRPLGRTPITVELAPGKHRLVLVNPELGQRRTREIAIQRGADTQIVDW